MDIIEFNGDPMLQLEKYDKLDEYIFYLNQESMDEINSYSDELKTNIPEFFNDINSSFILFAEGGIDEDGNEFPDTYIGIQSILKDECSYKITGIYASDLQYKAPKNGREILLKKNNVIVR